MLQCAPICGDGLLVAGENCDDGKFSSCSVLVSHNILVIKVRIPKVESVHSISVSCSELSFEGGISICKMRIEVSDAAYVSSSSASDHDKVTRL